MHVCDVLKGIDCSQVRAIQQENGQEPPISVEKPKLAWRRSHHSDYICQTIAAASLKSGASDCLDSVFRSERLFRIMGWVEQPKSRILVVDHNLLLREGLCTLIRLQPEMELVGAAASAGEAVDLFCKHRPEVVLMDLDLPESGGIRSIQAISAIDPTVRILGLLTHPRDEGAALALRAGARSCITKDRLDRDLVTLIRECLRVSG